MRGMNGVLPLSRTRPQRLSCWGTPLSLWPCGIALGRARLSHDRLPAMREPVKRGEPSRHSPRAASPEFARVLPSWPGSNPGPCKWMTSAEFLGIRAGCWRSVSGNERTPAFVRRVSSCVSNGAFVRSGWISRSIHPRSSRTVVASALLSFKMAAAFRCCGKHSCRVWRWSFGCSRAISNA